MQRIIERDSYKRDRLIVEVSDLVKITSFGEDSTSQTNEYFRRLNGNRAINGGDYYETHQVIGGILRTRGKYAPEALKALQQLPFVIVGAIAEDNFWWCPKAHIDEVREVLPAPARSMANSFAPFWNRNK